MTNVVLSNEQFKELLGSELPADYALNSVYEVENVLLLLKTIKDKIEYFKGLKKYRIQSVDAKVDDLEEKSDRLRSVVLHTMKKLDPNRTTLNFPDVGAVTRKKNPNKWEVKYEESMLAFLEKSGSKQDVVQVKEVIDSRKLKKTLDDFASARVTVPGVTLIEGGETVSVKYEEGKSGQEKTGSITSVLDDLDSLEL